MVLNTHDKCKVKVKLDNDAFLPKRAHEDDAGYDLFAPRDVVIPPLGKVTIDTGVHIELAKNTYGDVRSKSGLFFHHNIFTTGTIDAGYRGAIAVRIVNLGNNPYTFQKGDKIAQLVILPCLTPTLVEVEELSETTRGEKGFGSTGR